MAMIRFVERLEQQRMLHEKFPNPNANQMLMLLMQAAFDFESSLLVAILHDDWRTKLECELQEDQSWKQVSPEQTRLGNESAQILSQLNQMETL